MIDRRAFLALVGGFAATAAQAVEAQQSAHIAVLFNSSLQAQAPQVEAFRLGLRDYGWIEGENMRVEYRSAEGRADRVRALVGELVGLKVDAIVASGTIALRALQQATSTIPWSARYYCWTP